MSRTSNLLQQKPHRTQPGYLTWHPALAAFLLIAALVPAAQCSADRPTNEKVCTSMGCAETAVTIEIKGLPPGGHIVEIETDGTKTTYTCEVDGKPPESEEPVEGTAVHKIFRESCVVSKQGRFASIVVWMGGKNLGTFAPDYRTYLPNGPGCEPECLGAKIQIQL